MSRIFRAKKQSEKEWLESFDISNDLSTITTVDGEELNVEDDEIVLNQCTGKPDKNGQDIYEDDILAENMRVIWSEENCGWVKEDENRNQFELEDDELITGNAWD